MMTETQRRIRAYKKALPALRERVIAVALLLAMSASMLTSASFAWLTISRRPEVTGVSTTVAANGNLEIALATSTTAPGESQVGDSSAAEGQSVTAANITWGNLVNLSDESYGLENLTLRPAQLNLSSLLVSPLYGAVYEDDGRVSKLNSSFAYASWDTEHKMFMVPNAENKLPTMGVRAISSTTVEAVGFAQQVKDKRDAAESANLAAGNAYLAITQNQAYMNSLAFVMGTYMTAELNADENDASLTNPSIDQAHIKNLRDIFGDFVAVYNQQFDAMTKLANYQLFLKNNDESGSKPYTEKSVEAIMNASESSLKAEGLQLNGLNQAKTDYANLCAGWEDLKVLYDQGSVKWADSGLNDIVNSLMNTGACTLDGTRISNIGIGNATQYLDSKTHNAVITNGVLYNFEKLNGARCRVEGLEVSAKMKVSFITVPATISANITTNAPVPAQFSTDLTYSDTLNKGAKGVEIAQDTYGLAIDLWVRTNASGSYLTLEGNVLTTTETVRATGTDANGNVVELYTLERTEEVTGEDGTTETATYTLDLYKVETTAEGETEATVTWHNASGHAVVTVAEDETPIAKMTEVVTVVGFEGENRIWEDAQPWKEGSLISLDATTQGSGSCYVYYADSPEDQARSLELLDAMNVAFVDDQGTLLATAVMDTERYYAENGRVTVPLVLQSDSLEVGTTASGDTIYGITALDQNVPKRITAIVYLDGTRLTNQEVLAASDIQGKLNIQFGSSTALSHVEDEALLVATRTVSASVSNTKFVYDQALESGTPMTTTVTVNVDGDAPSKVTGFFIRAISSTQGSREKEMTFIQQADGSWTADYTFTAPGNYVLRSVDLDGQTYDLATCPAVTVEGFTVQSLSCTQATNKHVTIMTAASSSTVDLKLQFASSNVEAMPKTVQGRFLRSDGTAVNINFTYNAGGPDKGYWTGSATFISSGDYTLQYLVLDGQYTELDSTLWQTASVTLGMKTAVYTDSPVSFKYVPSTMADNEKNLYMKVKIMDNTGEEMLGLQDLRLYYAMQGSTVNGMDAPLTWNGSSGYYECKFRSEIGMYYFSQVTVGNNTITYATTSPTFRIISPEPPTFNSGSSVAQQYSAPGGTQAELSVVLDNCTVGTVYADVTRVKGTSNTTVSIQGTYSEGEWIFKIPQDTDGTSDGKWTINRLRLWDVYDKDGNQYTEASPLVFEEELNGEDGLSTKVVSTVKVIFTENLSQDFTGNSFLQPYTVSGLHVDFTDYEDKKLTDEKGNILITDVQLTFEYVSGSSSTYGGYRSDDLTNATDGATVTVKLTNVNGDGIHFVQSEDAQLLYAGSYTTTLSYKVQNVSKSATNTDAKPLSNMPVFTVSSAAPTVTISSVSTNPTTARYYTSATPGDTQYNSMLTGSYNNKIDDYSATVYMYFAAKSNYDAEAVEIKYPTVSLSLSGLPSDHSGVTLVVPNGSNSSYSNTFTFAAGGTTASSSIGGGVNGTYDYGYYVGGYGIETYPVLYPAGKQTVSQINVTYGGVEYKVNLSHGVTINNPLYPPSVEFKTISSIDSTYTGSTPSRVYSTDGETITIKLPDATTGNVTMSWTEAMSTTQNQDFVVQSGYPTTRNVYTERSETTGSGCNQTTTTYYTPYTETTTVSKASSSTTTWTRTHAITGWKIGNKVYMPGETATVTGNQTIIAVVGYTDGAKTTTSSTTTRTVIAYTANGSETTSKPSGSKVDSVTGSSTDVVS